MYSQGKVCREKALNAMRMWQMLSLVAEVDVTYGVAAGVAEMLQITPMELEGPQVLGLGPTPKLREARARVAFLEMQQHCNSFRHSERFRTACEGHIGGLLMMTLHKETALRACNATFDQLFLCGADPYYDDLMRHKMIDAFMQASAVCPEDRDIMTQLHVEMLFARDLLPSQTLFVKAFGHDGKIRLLIMNVQWSRHGNEEQTILRIEQAPPSRHITLTPHAPPHAPGFIMRTFRQTTFQERVAVSYGGAAAVAGGAGAAVTAMMCGPFPITPSYAWESMKSFPLQAYARDIFGLPASKERLQAVSESICLPTLLLLDDKEKQKHGRKPSSSPLPWLAVHQQPEEQAQAATMNVSQPASWDAGGERKEHGQQEEEEEGEEEDLLIMLEPILNEGFSPLLPDIL